MPLFRRKKTGVSPMERQRALQAVPVRSREISWEKAASGFVMIRYPIRIRPWIAAMMRRFGLTPGAPVFKKLELDFLGTEVWDLMDGARSVEEIAGAFAAQNRLDPAEAEVSVTAFIRELGRRGIVGLR